jgi:hypothetical protein
LKELAFFDAAPDIAGAPAALAAFAGFTGALVFVLLGIFVREGAGFFLTGLDFALGFALLRLLAFEPFAMLPASFPNGSSTVAFVQKNH